MGFDMTIKLHFEMCSSTGKPYVWRRHTCTKQYIDNNSYTIPERFRKWCQARGSHFHAYIASFDTTNDAMDSEGFLQFFPSWITVQSLIGDNARWTEHDHNEFKAALEYLAEKPGYMLVWSY